jgi:peptide/nickel transport system substrate-binding protein
MNRRPRTLATGPTEDQTTLSLADQISPSPSPANRNISRRQLLTVAGSGLAVAGIRQGVRGQTASPVPVGATPAASPVGSPVASPVAQASPIAPGPEMIGQLTVVRDQHPTYSAKHVRGGTLTIGRVGKTNLDFNPAAFAQDFQIPASYLEPLVWIDGVSMEPKPWLATSWTWNKTDTEITYKLRDDVTWHDGERFGAKDAAFAFEVYRDDIYSANYNLFTNMETAEAIDDVTLKVTLSVPDGNWIRNASSQLIFQREQLVGYWQANEPGSRTLTGFDWEANTPVGTGPWIIDAFRDSRVEFKANRAYWTDSPWTSQMRADFMPDNPTLLKKWHDGDADVVWPVNATDLVSISDRTGFLYAAESTRVMFAAFNFDNPARADPNLFSNPDIRTALSLGIDRARYGQNVFGSFCRTDLAGTIIQPDLYLDGLANPAYDPQRARAMLVRAGFSDATGDGILRYGDGTALKIDVIVASDSDSQLPAVLASISEDLRAVGVVIDVRPLSPDRFDQIWLTEHTFDLIAFSYTLSAGFTDFDLYGSDWDVRTNTQGFNPGGYRNEAVNRAISRALVATDESEYLSALHAIQRTVAGDDLFALWFGSPDELVLTQADVSGFQPNKVWQTLESGEIWKTQP